jgi:hypothetical protein
MESDPVLQMGKSAAVDTSATDLWFKRLPELMEVYKARDIYNVDETSLFSNVCHVECWHWKERPALEEEVQKSDSQCYCAQTAMAQTNEYPSLLEGLRNHGV